MPYCFVVFLASLSMTEPPLELTQPEDLVKVSPSKQEPPPAPHEPKEPPAPKPDPDAWIQVEKRHRQGSGKPKVEKEWKCHRAFLTSTCVFNRFVFPVYIRGITSHLARPTMPHRRPNRTRRSWTSCLTRRWSSWPPGRTSSQTGRTRTTQTMSWTTRTSTRS